MNKIKALIIVFLLLNTCPFSVPVASADNPYEAPHSSAWTKILEETQGFLDRIFNMIKELFKFLGDKLGEIKDRLGFELSRLYDWLRQKIKNIFDFYNGKGPMVQGYFERFKGWFNDFWKTFFPPKNDSPPDPPINAEKSGFYRMPQSLTAA